MSVKSYSVPTSGASTIEFRQLDEVLGGNTSINTVATRDGVLCVCFHMNQKPAGSMNILIKVNGVDQVAVTEPNPAWGHMMSTSTVNVSKGDTVQAIVTIINPGVVNLYFRTYMWFL
jgi:hypothetical protein